MFHCALISSCVVSLRPVEIVEQSQAILYRMSRQRNEVGVKSLKLVVLICSSRSAFVKNSTRRG